VIRLRRNPVGAAAPEGGRMQRLNSRVALSAATVAAGALLLIVPAARATTPLIDSYSVTPSAAQAGGHPDIDFQFTLHNRTTPERLNSPCDCEDPREVAIHLPTGLIGNPHATPQCAAAEFPVCPIDSQIGITEVVGSLNGIPVHFVSPVYNLQPRPGEAGLLAFPIIFEGSVFISIEARTGSDYGLDAIVRGIPHTFPLTSVNQVLWGVPADPSHDPLRFTNGPYNGSTLGNVNSITLGSRLCDAGGSASTADPTTVVQICNNPGFSTPSNSPLAPFLQNPTTCDPLTASLDVSYYDEATDHAEIPYPAATGCDSLSFNPSLAAQPTTERADSPSGLDVELTVPQFETPGVPSPSEIKSNTVTLPEGMSINPNAADGKLSCSDQAAAFGTEDESQCPEFSKVGSLEIQSAVLPGPLTGSVYLGEPKPGERYRLVLVANGFGIHVKLPGTVAPNQQTGQLVASFENLPQTPFQEFDLHFFGSERGVLATPTQCGTFPIETNFVPWDASLPAETSTQFFTIDEGPDGRPCPEAVRPFGPSFAAASASNTAAAHTPFSLELNRPDGDQSLSGLTVTTPPGFAATLKGVPYCSDAALAAANTAGYSGASELADPSCPAASQIGTSISGAGAGDRPVYLAGKVYLAGPYKGAPVSLAVITPAVSGPYDLGNVVVRAAIHVNPETAQITTIADPLPQILEGIPLRLRSVRVNLDRPGFALNPSNCSPFAVSAQITGIQGTVASPSSPFQVANCSALAFSPKLQISLTGQTKRSGNPALKAVVTYPKQGAYANIAKAQVSLPHSEFLDQGNLNKICTRPALLAGNCPKTSVYGTAKAWTPLLEAPLDGPVYLVGGYGYKLPAMVAELNGQIKVLLVGKVDTDKQHGIRNTFEAVPDAAVEKFVLELKGGKKYGLLENSENICKKPQKAEASFIGQNGAVDDYKTTIANSCGTKAQKQSKRANSNGRTGR
jgi:hypothetical protein